MAEPFVSFDGVWKKFRYGEIHDSLRDLVPALTARILGRGPDPTDLSSGDFWALRDVSFTVRPGHALGIIGPNGAGKSTVLKILTQILRPTRGDCVVSGRVGALIEVAAGFHPDLTGRENVYLQGAIMGMEPRETRRKFEQIVEFAGVAPFIDTPVKRYSTGMHARLGFAIAAHLDPDVLLVDEVLAVGDAAFQEKAFARVRELVRRGNPVVVVSHQLPQIAELCTQAILLNRGRVVHAGAPRDCIAAYVREAASTADAVVGDAAVRIHSVELRGETVRSGGDARITVHCTARAGGWIDREAVGVRVRSAQSGDVVFATSTMHCDVALPLGGDFAVRAALQLNVPAGAYIVETYVWDRIDERESFPGPCAQIDVTGGEEFRGAVQMNPRLEIAAAAEVG